MKYLTEYDPSDAYKFTQAVEDKNSKLILRLKDGNILDDAKFVGTIYDSKFEYNGKKIYNFEIEKLVIETTLYPTVDIGDLVVHDTPIKINNSYFDKNSKYIVKALKLQDLSVSIDILQIYEKTQVFKGCFAFDVVDDYVIIASRKIVD